MTTEEPLPYLNIDAMARVLVRHEQLLPVDTDPPRAGYNGGTSCGCGTFLGELDPTIYDRLARHQAEVLTARPDVYVVTET